MTSGTRAEAYLRQYVEYSMPWRCLCHYKYRPNSGDEPAVVFTFQLNVTAAAEAHGYTIFGRLLQVGPQCHCLIPVSAHQPECLLFPDLLSAKLDKACLAGRRAVTQHG